MPTPPTTILDNAVTDVLDRLGDLANQFWSRDEISMYYRDASDSFCHDTGILFDTVVIENLPPVGNWQTDFERYKALQHPGWGVTDLPFNATLESQRREGTADRAGVGAPYATIPVGMTSPSERTFAPSVDGALSAVPTVLTGGLVPDDTVEIRRVMWNRRELMGLGSQQMRKMDPNYEVRQGDPQFFVFDKDGLRFMRFVPAASSNAVYPTVNGGFGTATQLLEPESGTGSTVIPDMTNYWAFEETGPWLDSIGSNNFTLTTGAIGSTTGVHNLQASLAAGTGSMTSTSTFSKNGSFSLSFWWTPVTTVFQSKFVQLTPVTGTTIELQYDSGSGNIRQTSTTSATGTAVLSPGTAYHIVYTYSDTGVSKVYVNGTLDSTLNEAATGEARILLTRGSFDEMAFFVRDLTVAEIASLYNSGTGKFYPSDLGTLVVTSTITTVDVNGYDTGGFGALVGLDSFGSLDSGMFPSGGPWGGITQIHPSNLNFRIEITRTSRDVLQYPSEVPLPYQKYVVYYAMEKALRRDGPGQDIELADHYKSRYEMGVDRLRRRRDKMNAERVGQFGNAWHPESFALGMPLLPYPYDAHQW